MHAFRSKGLMAFVLVAAMVTPLLAQTVPLDALLRGGRIHYEGNRYERALEQFQKALDQYGPTADATTLSQIHTWVGLSQAQLKRFPDAAESFLTALEKDPEAAARIRANEEWQYQAGISLLTLTRERYFAADHEPALRYALGALKIDPSKAQIYSLIANIYSALGRYEEMRATAYDLLKLDAKSAEAFGLLGLYFLQKPDSLWSTAAAKAARWDSAGVFYDDAIAAYNAKFEAAKTTLGQTMKLSDPARLDELSWQFIRRSRQGQASLKRFIENDLKAGKQLVELAGIASQLHSAANNLNITNSRAGSAMLAASAQTRADTSERFRSRSELYFGRAVQYDSSDFTALFDLGIAYYQAKRDSLAEAMLAHVTGRGIIELGQLPPALQESLIARIDAAAAEAGRLEITGPLAATVDSVAATQLGREGVFAYLFVPGLAGSAWTGSPTPEQRGWMFVSAIQPLLVEEAFLWLGSSQTGLATVLADAKRLDDAKVKYAAAIANLTVAVRLNPRNADAYQNLGICYRELGDKQKALDYFERADKIRKGK
jgi:tetratricopeptide (TPR) repeat protein